MIQALVIVQCERYSVTLLFVWNCELLSLWDRCVDKWVHVCSE